MNATRPQDGPRAPKVLIIGDVGCGKSTIIHYLQSLSSPSLSKVNNDMQDNRTRASTIGFNCETVLLRRGNKHASSLESESGAPLSSSSLLPSFIRSSSGHQPAPTSSLQPIDFIEIGGNRSFHENCRAAAYKMPLNAVILVYVLGNFETCVNLLTWYNEIVKYNVLGHDNSTAPSDTFPSSYIKKHNEYQNHQGVKFLLLGISHNRHALQLHEQYMTAQLCEVGRIHNNDINSRTLLYSLLGSSLDYDKFRNEELKCGYSSQKGNKYGSFGAALGTIRRIIYASIRAPSIMQDTLLKFLDRTLPPYVYHLTVKAVLATKTFVNMIYRILLIFMAIILFGPGQRVVSYHVPTAVSALETIRADSVAMAVDAQVSISSARDFADSCQDLVDFLGSL